MVSTRTINRQRKVKLLRESSNGILDLLLMEHKQRDRVNMSYFKKLKKQVEEMKEMAI